MAGIRLGTAVFVASALLAGAVGVGAPTASASPPGLISIGGASLIEGGNMAFDVTLSNPSTSPVSVRWGTSRDTATPSPGFNTCCNGDYGEKSGVVSFPAGVTEKRVVVRTFSNEFNESDEQFHVGLFIGSATGGYDLGPHSSDFGTIIENTCPFCSTRAFIGDASLVEGDSGKRSLDFNVSLVAVSAQAVLVDYTVSSDTASCGPVRMGQPVDSSSDCSTLNGTRTLRFPVTTTGFTRNTAVISVPVFPDTNVEGNETFHVTLSNARTASGPVPIERATGIGTIIDDD